MLQIGTLVDNKYKILNEVGHGGMSVVYLAINERANKTWAVKEIRKDGVCDFEAVKQGLVVETDMLKRLNHDHLPSIIDVIDQEDSFLIVMDYIEGQSLQAVLKNGGAQPQKQVLEWGIQLCDVLGYLHSQNPPIIYRDMKPANVMLRPNGDVTLIDFGTAREFKNRSMVEDTTCLGTRGYAAPEQFGGRGQTDARTDIYCLGATLYHLITGHSPAEPPYEIKPLSYWNPAFSGSGLEYIISKCCQQDPSARYQSCAELMYDLEHVEEVDYHTQRSRRMKWNAFLASVLVFLISVGGMIGTTLGKNNAMNETYDARLKEAQTIFSEKGSLEEMVQTINAVVEVNPGKYDAYSLMLDYVEQDRELDLSTEYTALTKLLRGETVGNNEKNENILRETDPEGYADLQFRMGRLLALLSTGEENRLRSAASYFENALADGSMEASADPSIQEKVRIARSFAVIGNYIDTLGNTKGNLFLDQENSYYTLWEHLNELYTDNSLETMQNPSFGIEIYSRIANLIFQNENYRNFRDVGVTYEQMTDLLSRMEQSLRAKEQEMSGGMVSEEYQNLFAKAYGNITNTRNTLTSAMNQRGGGAA